MTSFLSDPIPPQCDQALVHYSSAVQNQGLEVETSQVDCYKHATRRNGLMGGKEHSQAYLHMIQLQYSVPDCVPLFACVN